MSNPEPVILTGDCLERLEELPDASVDAVITDPPYGLSNTDPARVADTLAKWATGEDTYVPEGRGFMGASWDGFVPPPAVWKECLRVLKPGGHLAVFAGSRTQDLMGLSVRLAGFDIRDGISWIYGSGFPKGRDMGKAVESRLTAGNSDSREAKKWSGWKSQLKPANEPIILARKPFPGALVGNVMEHGVGALNIDASRVGDSAGRHPANVLLDERAAAEMDKQSGNFPGVLSGMKQVGGKVTFTVGDTPNRKQFTPSSQHKKDYGGASRFFPVFKYQRKAPKKERPVIEREDGTRIHHPTVKPLALMEWLITLLTPEGGTVLDPFAGSGTTLEAARNNGFHSTGIEREEAYVALIHERLNTER